MTAGDFFLKRTVEADDLIRGYTPPLRIVFGQPARFRIACVEDDERGVGFAGLTSQVVVSALGLTVRRNGGNSLGGVVLAGLVHTLVGVIRLQHGLVGCEPVVRPEVPATAAT